MPIDSIAVSAYAEKGGREREEKTISLCVRLHFTYISGQMENFNHSSFGFTMGYIYKIKPIQREYGSHAPVCIACVYVGRILMKELHPSGFRFNKFVLFTKYYDVHRQTGLICMNECHCACNIYNGLDLHKYLPRNNMICSNAIRRLVY